jgi:hypothetical protein
MGLTPLSLISDSVGDACLLLAASSELALAMAGAVALMTGCRSSGTSGDIIVAQAVATCGPSVTRRALRALVVGLGARHRPTRLWNCQ